MRTRVLSDIHAEGKARGHVYSMNLRSNCIPGVYQKATNEIHVTNCSLVSLDACSLLRQTLSTVLCVCAIACVQIVVISDVFSTSGQFEWMLGTFLEQIATCSQDDVPSYAALVYGILKCTAVERTVSSEVPSRYWQYNLPTLSSWLLSSTDRSPFLASFCLHDALLH